MHRRWRRETSTKWWGTFVVMARASTSIWIHWWVHHLYWLIACFVGRRKYTIRAIFSFFVDTAAEWFYILLVVLLLCYFSAGAMFSFITSPLSYLSPRRPFTLTIFCLHAGAALCQRRGDDTRAWYGVYDWADLGRGLGRSDYLERWLDRRHQGRRLVMATLHLHFCCFVVRCMLFVCCDVRVSIW